MIISKTINKNINFNSIFHGDRYAFSRAGAKVLFGFHLFCLIFLSIFPENSYSQEVPRVRIYGKVIDASTRKSLYFANVFLSNTTLGAATDEMGVFTIVNIPLGTHELTVSMMGYELQTRSIDLTKPVDREFNFRLKPKPIQAPELKVTADIPKEWKKNLKKFERYFLGLSPNASKCEILNSEILDFEFNEETNELKSSASGPLLIENRALGYRIHTHLKNFLFREDFDGEYVCNSRYEPLVPKNEREGKKWKKNRLKAYYGSKRHFFISLVKNRLDEEGYVLRNVLTATIRDLSLQDENIYFNAIKAADILARGKKDFEGMLSFPNYLQVIYTKEEEAKDYIWSRHHRGTGQFSWLKMNMNNVTVNALGHVYNPYALTIDGYMAWERFAETLPLDYSPDAPIVPVPEAPPLFWSDRILLPKFV